MSQNTEPNYSKILEDWCSTNGLSRVGYYSANGNYQCRFFFVVNKPRDGRNETIVFIKNFLRKLNIMLRSAPPSYSRAGLDQWFDHNNSRKDYFISYKVDSSGVYEVTIATQEEKELKSKEAAAEDMVKALGIAIS